MIKSYKTRLYLTTPQADSDGGLECARNDEEQAFKQSCTRTVLL